MRLYPVVFLLAVVFAAEQCQAKKKGDTSQRVRRRNEEDRPNIIMILADDLGYGDLATYGHPTQEYGPIDTMAASGLRFMQAYSADSICSPSRASLLTACTWNVVWLQVINVYLQSSGRLPVRTGVWGEGYRVFVPWLKTGLPRNETTIAEALKEFGYTTGMVGKWHLGINKDANSDGYHLPMNHGFDFVGHNIPFGGTYSCETTGRYGVDPDPTKCFSYYGEEIIQQPYHQENLTVLFVNDTLEFIRTNRDRPFFFYFAMMHPHAPLFSSAQFKGSSRRGNYGDNVNEMSWAVGSVIKELEDQEIAEETLVVFMSDNGPHIECCLEGGDPGIFRGFKTNSFEGGYRVPLISYWPGVIKPGISNELFSSLDLFPIFLNLAGGTVTNDRAYDFVNDDVDVLLGKAPSTRNFILFYNRDVLFAVRYGKYKVHFFTQDDKTPEELAEHCLPPGYPNGPYFDCNKKDVSYECVREHDPPLLFDLEIDPSESWPLDPANHDGLLADVQRLLDEHNSGLERALPLLDTEDRGVIPCCNATTDCICNYP